MCRFQFGHGVSTIWMLKYFLRVKPIDPLGSMGNLVGSHLALQAKAFAKLDCPSRRGRRGQLSSMAHKLYPNK